MSALGAKKTALLPGMDLAAARRFLADSSSTFGRWSLPYLLPAAGVSVIYGPSGSSKSFLLVAAAVSLGAGMEWAGEAIQSGSVLYVAGEDFSGIPAQMIAFAERHNLDYEKIPVRIVEPFSAATQPSFSSEITETGVAYVEQTGVAMAAVIIDTLGACFGPHSQDDAHQMTAAVDNFYAIARQLKCPVAVAHHTGKDGKVIRGSQVLVDRADAVLRVWRTSEGNKTVLEKSRNGARGRTILATIGNTKLDFGDRSLDTMTVTKLTLAVGDGERHAPLYQNDRKRMERTDSLPRDAQTALGQLQLLEAAKGSPVLLVHWKEATISAFGLRTDGALREAFSNAKKILTEREFIDVKGSFVSVRNRQNSSEF